MEVVCVERLLSSEARISRDTPPPPAPYAHAHTHTLPSSHHISFPVYTQTSFYVSKYSTTKMQSVHIKLNKNSKKNPDRFYDKKW